MTMMMAMSSMTLMARATKTKADEGEKSSRMRSTRVSHWMAGHLHLHGGLFATMG